MARNIGDFADANASAKGAASPTSNLKPTVDESGRKAYSDESGIIVPKAHEPGQQGGASASTATTGSSAPKIDTSVAEPVVQMSTEDMIKRDAEARTGGVRVNVAGRKAKIKKDSAYYADRVRTSGQVEKKNSQLYSELTADHKALAAHVASANNLVVNKRETRSVGGNNFGVVDMADPDVKGLAEARGHLDRAYAHLNKFAEGINKRETHTQYANAEGAAVSIAKAHRALQKTASFGDHGLDGDRIQTNADIAVGQNSVKGSGKAVIDSESGSVDVKPRVRPAGTVNVGGQMLDTNDPKIRGRAIMAEGVQEDARDKILNPQGTERDLTNRAPRKWVYGDKKIDDKGTLARDVVDATGKTQVAGGRSVETQLDAPGWVANPRTANTVETNRDAIQTPGTSRRSAEQEAIQGMRVERTKGQRPRVVKDVDPEEAVKNTPVTRKSGASDLGVAAMNRRDINATRQDQVRKDRLAAGAEKVAAKRAAVQQEVDSSTAPIEKGRAYVAAKVGQESEAAAKAAAQKKVAAQEKARKTRAVNKVAKAAAAKEAAKAAGAPARPKNLPKKI